MEALIKAVKKVKDINGKKEEKVNIYQNNKRKAKFVSELTKAKGLNQYIEECFYLCIFKIKKPKFNLFAEDIS